MTRRAGTVVVVVGLAAVLAGVVFLLGGPGALFGRGDSGPDAAPGTAPEKAEGSRLADGAVTREQTIPDAAVLFGRPRAQRRGTGGLALRVLRWKDQKPVEGAEILLSGLGNGDERVELHAKSDARGAAAWADVPAGDAFALRVAATGEPETRVPGVAVESGRTRDLVVYVGQRSALSGRVVDEQGKPIARADVRVYPGYEGLFDMLTNFMDLFTSLDKEPTPLAKAETDAKGEFTFPDLSPGPLLLRATSVAKRQAVVSVKLGSAGPAAPVTLVLESGVAVAGVVVEASGAPIAGARISLMSEDASDPGSIFLGRSFASTDERGTFRVRVAEDAKRLRAFVAASGFPTTVSKTFAAGDESVRIVVAAGARLEVVVVDAGSGQPIPGASVILGVSDAEGGPDMAAGGALVTAVTDDRGTASMTAPPGAIEMAMVSAPGHGAGMAAPRSSGGDAGGSPFGAMENDLPARLEAGKTAHATVRLAGGYALKGRVLDPAGHGIEGAEVKSSSIMGMGGAPLSTKSDAEGRYRLAGVTAASVILTVHATGWVQREADKMSFLSSRFGGMSGKKPETPAPGTEVQQDFTLYPSVTVRGTVLDEKGEPVAGAQVAVADGMGLSMLFGGKDAEATTASDGSFVLYDLDPSTGSGGGIMAAMAAAAAGMDGAPPPPPAPGGKNKLTLRATADGFVPAKSDAFEVEGGGTVTAPPIRLGRGATIEGRVRDLAGGALGGAKVEVSKSTTDADPMQQMRDAMSGKKGDVLRADAAGQFRVDTLPKGKVTLTVSAEGHAAARRTVEVGDGPPAPLEIRLPQGQALAGRVVGRDGRPVANATVAVTGAAEGTGDEVYVAPVDGTTKEDGTYSLSPLPPGRVRATVSAPGKRAQTLTIATGGTAPDVVLEDRPAADTARLAEIKTELADVTQKMVAAKTSDERTTLRRRMTALMREQRELEAGEGPAPAMSDEDK